MFGVCRGHIRTTGYLAMSVCVSLLSACSPCLQTQARLMNQVAAGGEMLLSLRVGQRPHCARRNGSRVGISVLQCWNCFSALSLKQKERQLCRHLTLIHQKRSKRGARAVPRPLARRVAQGQCLLFLLSRKKHWHVGALSSLAGVTHSRNRACSDHGSCGVNTTIHKFLTVLLSA